VRPRSVVPLDAILEDSGITAAAADVRPLEVGFKARDEARTPFVVVPDLAAAKEAARVQPRSPGVCQRRAAIDKTARHDVRGIEAVRDRSDRIEKRRCVSDGVGGSSPIIACVQAGIESGPRWRRQRIDGGRRFDGGKVGRKSRAYAQGKQISADQTRLHPQLPSDQDLDLSRAAAQVQRELAATRQIAAPVTLSRES
jgi:hypothetical protein